MNSLFMRFPDGRPKALTLSYDDAVGEDVRLIEIMKKHGLKGTFNINSGIRVTAEEQAEINSKRKYAFKTTYDEVSRTYAQEGIEVAVHGKTHPFLETLPPAQVALEVLDDRRALEAQFGTIVRGMAYPQGTYSDEVVSVLRSCGIVYSRAVKSTEKFDLPDNWLVWQPTCHHTNKRLMEIAKSFLEVPYDNLRHPKLFYLWGHAYEFEQFNNWEVIEDFAEMMGGRDEIWYATNIEIYDYVEAFKRLEWSVGMTMVHNPTAMPLWFCMHNEMYCVNPGETLKID